MLKVPQEEAVSLLLALGLKTAPKMSPKMLTAKLQKIESLQDDDAGEIEDKKTARLLKRVIAAKGDVSVDTGDDEESSDGDEEATPPPKVKKEKKEKKEKEPKEHRVGRPPGREGVIATIISLVSVATKKKPITKEAIHEELKKKFPERAAESMWSTINIQIPGRLRIERGLIIEKVEGGYFLDRVDESVIGQSNRKSPAPKAKPAKEEKTTKPAKPTKKKVKDSEEEDE